MNRGHQRRKRDTLNLSFSESDDIQMFNESVSSNIIFDEGDLHDDQEDDVATISSSLSLQGGINALHLSGATVDEENTHRRDTNAIKQHDSQRSESQLEEAHEVIIARMLEEESLEEFYLEKSYITPRSDEDTQEELDNAIVIARLMEEESLQESICLQDSFTAQDIARQEVERATKDAISKILQDDAREQRKCNNSQQSVTRFIQQEADLYRSLASQQPCSRRSFPGGLQDCNLSQADLYRSLTRQHRNSSSLSGGLQDCNLSQADLYRAISQQHRNSSSLSGGLQDCNSSQADDLYRAISQQHRGSSSLSGGLQNSNSSQAMLLQDIQNPVAGTPRPPNDESQRIDAFFRLCQDTKPKRDGTVADPSRWEPIRNFMFTSPQLMQRAARKRNPHGLTALHLVCCHQPPVNVIELLISCGGLESLSVEDQFGRLPVHYACENTASVEVVKALVQLYPECKVKQDALGKTPLHLGILNQKALVNVVECVCSKGAASVQDRWGMLPLHYAVQKGFAKPQAIKIVIAAYPLGLSHMDLKGRAPVHWLVKACDENVVLSLLEFSLALDPALAKGDMGIKLLHHLQVTAEARSPNAQTALELILRCNPDPSDIFVQTLKDLPRWLDKGDSVRRRAFFRRHKK